MRPNNALKGGDAMQRRDNNGLGILILVVIMAVTPLVPAAVSATSPQWVWDSDGKVSDASGQFRSLTDQEACVLYGLCKEIKLRDLSTDSDSTGSDGGPSDGGGCR